jgi:hypothetical protein
VKALQSLRSLEQFAHKRGKQVDDVIERKEPKTPAIVQPAAQG